MTYERVQTRRDNFRVGGDLNGGGGKRVFPENEKYEHHSERYQTVSRYDNVRRRRRAPKTMVKCRDYHCRDKGQVNKKMDNLLALFLLGVIHSSR
jgi:hypothetical protein